MANPARCRCMRCTTRSFMGPAVLITLGVLFLIGHLNPDYGFWHRTWPVLLLVIGAVKLGEALVSDEGHVTQ